MNFTLMKTISVLHPLCELARCFRGRRRELQIPKHVEEDIALDVYEQINGEAIQRENKIEATAHADETADREALRLIDVAQAPDSDGGCFITPKEAAAIRRNVSRSAELAHDVGELAKVGEV